MPPRSLVTYSGNADAFPSARPVPHPGGERSAPITSLGAGHPSTEADTGPVSDRTLELAIIGALALVLGIFAAAGVRGLV